MFIKFLLLYTTAILTVILLCSVTLNLQFFVLLFIDYVLIHLCMKHITFKELIRLSGYRIWYLNLR